MSPLSVEEMDKRCTKRKNEEYCEGTSKKQLQERFISYNPDVKIEDLVKMHTYELCRALKGGDESEQEGEDMSEKDMDILERDSEAAMAALVAHRNATKTATKPKSKKETDAEKKQEGSASRRRSLPRRRRSKWMHGMCS